ncbi:Protein of unknown function [Pyronema omphalodes CBS 100304]|uniref:Uncharacterized protein n=1 Tax=Pyronema omphalodes (strain CBS 100304) TaxID=1076935 RepID=U4KXN4_PYROM|nr:Protein of unknown function [Pyronema omphalodes CBS 100304]
MSSMWSTSCSSTGQICLSIAAVP